MTFRRVVTTASVMALVSLIGLGVFAWSNGVRFYAVDSDSMSPAFRTGALIVDMPTTPATAFRVGDVVTFHPTPGYTATHRITAIGVAGITTKGDANSSSDVGFIQPNMIVGRVAFSVPFGGYVAMFFRQPVGVAALVGVMVLLYLAWELLFARKPSAHGAPDLTPPEPNAAGGSQE